MKRRFAITLGSSLLLAWPLACSDDPAASVPATASPDAGGGDGAAADSAVTGDASTQPDAVAPSDGAADSTSSCHEHPNDAATIGATVLAEPMPTATGGTIAAGIYHLTAVKYYAGADAATPTLTETWKQTLVIEGSAFSVASIRGASPEQRSTGTYSTQGATVTFAESCPKAQANDGLGFSATADELRVLVPKDERVLVYGRQ